MRCDQVDDLLRLEAELQLETLRSIKEAEKVMDLWNYALPSLRQIRKQPPAVKKKKIKVSSILSPPGRRQ